MGMTVEIQTQGKEDFHFEEALKTLRTNIQFSGSNVKVIMFTSAVPGGEKPDYLFRGHVAGSPGTPRTAD